MERTLRQKGFNAVGMSSDKSQAERIAAIENFKSGKVRMLVATDVAGRGLDINDIALVLNYSFPLTIEDYVHRIGRTGRGGKTGLAITFFTRNEKHLSGELINVMREAGADVPEDLMKFGTGVKRKEHGMYGTWREEGGRLRGCCLAVACACAYRGMCSLSQAPSTRPTTARSR